MFNFIRIATDLYPADQVSIVTIDTDQVTIHLNGNPNGFYYKEQYAVLALAALSNVTLPTAAVIRFRAGTDLIDLSAVQWINLAAGMGMARTGVEIQLSSDPAGVTKQYTGDDAESIYDRMSLLIPEPSQSNAAMV